MKTRLKTSKHAEEILSSIKTKYHITPNIVCRYAVGLSLSNKDKDIIFDYDSNGRDFIRATLTGDDDLLIRELIKNYHGFFISDDDYMTKYLKAHIERGLVMLDREIQLCGSFDNYIDEQLRGGSTI